MPTNKESTLFSLVQQFDNDYSSSELEYRKVSSSELISREISSSQETDLPTVTIVAASYNQNDLLPYFINAINNQKSVLLSPTKTQLILVDDGSTENPISTLEKINSLCDVIFVRQKNHREPFALNTGLSLAEGDIIFLTNPDVLQSPNSIYEHQIRHKYLQSIATIGFRMHIMPEELSQLSNLDFNVISKLLPLTTKRDNKDGQFLKKYFSIIHNDDGSVLINSDNFKKYRGWQEILGRNLPACIEANSFCFRRNLLQLSGGFDEEMIDWGFYDNFFGAKIIGSCQYNNIDLKIIPITTSIGYHPWHDQRAYLNFSEKIEGSKKNLQIYETKKRIGFNEIRTPTLDNIKKNRKLSLIKKNQKITYYEVYN